MTATGREPGGSGRSADRLILRGYGPLAALVALLLLVTMLIPSRPEQDAALTDVTAGGGLPVPGTSAGVPGTTTDAPGTTTNPSSASTAVSPKATTADGKRQVTTRAAAGPRTASSCSGGSKQDGNTAYSPPCIAWAGGDNGGATSRGVTRDTITVTFRDIGNPLGDSDSELAKTAEKKGIVASPEATARTRAACSSTSTPHISCTAAG